MFERLLLEVLRLADRAVAERFQKGTRLARIEPFAEKLVDRVQKLPGVDAAGVVTALPLSGDGGSGTVTIDTLYRPEAI